MTATLNKYFKWTYTSTFTTTESHNFYKDKSVTILLSWISCIFLLNRNDLFTISSIWLSWISTQNRLSQICQVDATKLHQEWYSSQRHLLHHAPLDMIIIIKCQVSVKMNNIRKSDGNADNWRLSSSSDTRLYFGTRKKETTINYCKQIYQLQQLLNAFGLYIKRITSAGEKNWSHI